MEKFLYVFDEATRDRLLKRNFKLLKSNEKDNVYVFINDPEAMIGEAVFESDTILLSNMLTF